jgi:hypothetical protein
MGVARYDGNASERWIHAWAATAGGSTPIGPAFSWGLVFGNNTSGWASQWQNGYVQGNYHNFPCSKCHTPHTSRLPRLMKTNCLDVNMGGNTATIVQRHSKNANANINRMASSNTNSNNRWTGAMAVRCHNNGYYGTSGGAGDTRWNSVTVW